MLQISGIHSPNKASPCPPPEANEHIAPVRRHWTAGELIEIVTALASCRTSEIAKEIGVNPKALRSVLRRNGISLRALREHAKREQVNERAGLVVRRPASGPSATYGAAALAGLPDNACRWPCGDPADRDFAFCGRRALRRLPYCANHYARAFAAGEHRES